MSCNHPPCPINDEVERWRRLGPIAYFRRDLYARYLTLGPSGREHLLNNPTLPVPPLGERLKMRANKPRGLRAAGSLITQASGPAVALIPLIRALRFIVRTSTSLRSCSRHSPR